MNKQDFQYLLFLLDELVHVHSLSLKTDVWKENAFDKVKRIGQVVDLYLSLDQKAVILAPSERINKQLPIRDMNYYESNLLGNYLYQQYGKQYHAVSIQAGERTCLADTIVSDSVTTESYGIRWIYPVNENPLFPFSFEGVAMERGVSYFYYPSGQLPEGILGMGLNLDYSVFRYCHIPSHFDGLIFLREAKVTHNFLRSYPFSLWEFVKDIGLHFDNLQ